MFASIAERGEDFSEGNRNAKLRQRQSSCEISAENNMLLFLDLVFSVPGDLFKISTHTERRKKRANAAYLSEENEAVDCGLTFVEGRWMV